ncbi:unnamed protein product [Pleuronectes platessa]|uniref:Uncharacterized protein n=1 Tax=Pleuronectes platessa TaxID=8262 RepID=A0A9N7V5K4_PLEPL|nr:unnamed protein product [Pleuronectes platessa]
MPKDACPSFPNQKAHWIKHQLNGINNGKQNLYSQFVWTWTRAQCSIGGTQVLINTRDFTAQIPWDVDEADSAAGRETTTECNLQTAEIKNKGESLSAAFCLESVLVQTGPGTLDSSLPADGSTIRTVYPFHTRRYNTVGIRR